MATWTWIILQAITKIDGSIGWVRTLCEKMYCSGPDPFCAASSQLGGTAEQEADGWRVNGNIGLVCKASISKPRAIGTLREMLFQRKSFERGSNAAERKIVAAIPGKACTRQQQPSDTQSPPTATNGQGKSKTNLGSRAKP